MRILHELLEIDGRDIDVLEWLGHRYTEKCDFLLAREYYKRARNVKLSNVESVRFVMDVAETSRAATAFRRNVKSASFTPKYATQSDTTNITEQKRPEEESAVFSALTITKSSSRGYSRDLDVDEKEGQERVDYTRFTQKRVGTETIIYTPPEVGWEPAADFAAYNFFRSRKNLSREDALRATDARKLKTIDKNSIPEEEIL